jgi:hypothetical protein
MADSFPMLDTQMIPKMTDEEVRCELANSEPESRVYILLSEEIQRRSLDRMWKAASALERSSLRLERLTWMLVVFTVALIALAAAPAWHAIMGLFS